MNADENERDRLYDETVSDSMQESIAKAIAVLQREMFRQEITGLYIGLRYQFLRAYFL